LGAKTAALIGALREVPFATARVEFFDLGGQAYNWSSLVRWDRNRQRLASSFSGPLAGDPARRFAVVLDARREQWDLAGALGARASGPVELGFRSASLGLELDGLRGDRWSWRTGLKLAERRFEGAPSALASSAGLLGGGLVLEHDLGIDLRALSIPE